MPSATIEKHQHGFSLLLDGKPSLLLGGQVHNSSTSSKASIKSTFAKGKALNYNFVMGSVNWNQFEPVEGQFDFELIDCMIAEAEANGLLLTVIWFGAFKNAGSTYAPTWVRAHQARFSRAKISPDAAGANKPVLSVFDQNLLAADSKAFATLVEHLVANDKNGTVIMIQVENESGLLGASRDYSDLAEAAWKGQVPQALTDSLGLQSGSWEQVFGNTWQGHETFMAWHFASYVNSVAAAGKHHKNLPMFANAWLGPQPGQDQAGQWPSGGPSENVIDVWRLAAPNLSFVSPDIYILEADDAFKVYARENNPLFVPESRHVTGNLMLAIGNYGCIGWSVFGGEDGRVGNQISSAYATLQSANDLITSAQREDRIGVSILAPSDFEGAVQFGELTVKTKNSLAMLKRFVEVAGVDLDIKDTPQASELEDLQVTINSPTDNRAFALVIQESETEFVMIGKGINFDFEQAGATVEIDQIVEGSFAAGQWLAGRDLNGDERLNHLPFQEIGISRISILKFTR